MLRAPMKTIANSLPLRAEACGLLGAMNSAAMPLCMIRSFEVGSWDDYAEEARALGVGEATLSELYVKAVQCASELVEAAR